MQSKTRWLAFMSLCWLTLVAIIRSCWLGLCATQLMVFATSSNYRSTGSRYLQLMRCLETRGLPL
ncbi:hypothetical protein ALP07_200008 [Pseudomonas savastanoi pv. glycinea]|nr:hypothetical protein ALP07_200008 [Pseudomonas savastanoi pv. glycinea]